MIACGSKQTPGRTAWYLSDVIAQIADPTGSVRSDRRSAYCGARGRARTADVAGLERRGWWAQEKADGVYAEAGVGAGGAVAWVRYRSGELVTAADVRRARGSHRCQDLLGLRTPWAPGTVVAGELQVQTPAAARWQDAHGGARGLVLFDVLAVGDAEGLVSSLLAGRMGEVPAWSMAERPYVDRRAWLERAVGDLDSRASRVVQLVAQRRRGLAAWCRELVDGGAEGAVLVDPSAPAGRGKRKLKRVDHLGARVVAVLPGEGVARLDWGGVLFSVALPAFPLRAGQAVDVAATGFYDSDQPRHARLVRVREDLG